MTRIESAGAAEAHGQDRVGQGSRGGHDGRQRAGRIADTGRSMFMTFGRTGRLRSRPVLPAARPDRTLRPGRAAKGSGFLYLVRRVRRSPGGRSRTSFTTNASRSASGARRRARMRSESRDAGDAWRWGGAAGEGGARCVSNARKVAGAGARGASGFHAGVGFHAAPGFRAAPGSRVAPRFRAVSGSHAASGVSGAGSSRSSTSSGSSPVPYPSRARRSSAGRRAPASSRSRMIRWSRSPNPATPQPSWDGAASSPSPAMLWRIRVSEMTFCML